MSRYLIVDIETTASDEMPPLDSIKVPATHKKPESILAYQQEHQEEAWRKQALNSLEGRIICIGFCTLDSDVIVLSGYDEAANMRAFNDVIAGYMGVYNEPLVWTGWNIATFDLVWLWRKAIQYELPLRKFIPKDNRQLTCDLMRVFAADFKDYVSLSTCASFLGIEHDGGNGSEIHDLWQAGDLEGIENHCKRDLETTRSIHNKIFG